MGRVYPALTTPPHLSEFVCPTCRNSACDRDIFRRLEATYLGPLHTWPSRIPTLSSRHSKRLDHASRNNVSQLLVSPRRAFITRLLARWTSHQPSTSARPIDISVALLTPRTSLFLMDSPENSTIFHFADNSGTTLFATSAAASSPLQLLSRNKSRRNEVC